MASQGVPGVGREADAKVGGGVRIEPPLIEEPASDDGFCALELIGVVGGGDAVRLEQSGAFALWTPGPSAGLFVLQLDAEAGSKLLDGLLEREVLDALKEVDHVAAHLAAEAVVEALGGGDVKARAALFVKRAETLEAAPTGGAQGDVVAHHLG